MIEKKEQWHDLNNKLRFRLLAYALYISSDFLRLSVALDQPELPDERETVALEAISLSTYYVKAMNNNN